MVNLWLFVWKIGVYSETTEGIDVQSKYNYTTNLEKAFFFISRKKDPGERIVKKNIFRKESFQKTIILPLFERRQSTSF